jgi:SAM-dependent methyltransferase
MSSRDDVAFWDSTEVVAQYSADPWINTLLLGERLAFEACFQNGLKGRRILDLGCGAGRTTHYLHEIGADVVGVDISPSLIRIAKQRAPQIDYREGNAESLDFDAESFDAVLFSFNGLDCLYPKDRRLKVMREVRRVLCAEGRFIFSHHNLTAFFFGWHKFMRLGKLYFRATNILNGNALKNECYLSGLGSGELPLYYAWPKQVITDLDKLGFQLMHIYPNSPLLVFLQRSLRSDLLTRWADPWPYYIFCKVLP